MKTVIYTNDVCYEEVRESYELDFPNSEGYDDDSRIRIFYDSLQDDLEETKRILDFELDNIIVVHRKLKLWDGIHETLKIGGRNLNVCLYDHIGDIFEYYVEDHEFKCKDIHHDGTNFYTFRKMKDGLTRQDFEEYLLNHTFTQTMNDLTESLGDIVKKSMS